MSDKVVEPKVGKCVCGNTFDIPSKRGRPPVRCPECREAYANGTLQDRLYSLGLDHRVLRPASNKFRAPSTPQSSVILAQTDDGNEKPNPILSPSERIDRLEMMLKMAGTHISQHRDKWE